MPARQAALLARLLAEAMIANVQTTAGLNRSAADALLAQARLATPLRFNQLDDAWRASWCSFELSANTADRMLGLARGHIERSTIGLWRITETPVDRTGATAIEPDRQPCAKPSTLCAKRKSRTYKPLNKSISA